MSIVVKSADKPELLPDNRVLWAGHVWKRPSFEKFLSTTLSKSFTGYVVGLGKCQLSDDTLVMMDKNLTASVRRLRASYDKIGKL